MTSEQLIAIVVATLGQFIVGAIWYTPLFGKIWGKIHGFDKIDKKSQEKMMAQMMPLLGFQFLITLVTSYVLTQFQQLFPSFSLMTITFWIWFGFVAPAQIAANVFGGTKPQWLVTKSAIMIAGSLVVLMVGTILIELILK